MMKILIVSTLISLVNISPCSALEFCEIWVFDCKVFCPDRMHCQNVRTCLEEPKSFSMSMECLEQDGCSCNQKNKERVQEYDDEEDLGARLNHSSDASI